jgi:uncharacterized RDD family membrane protein YckC
MDAGGRKHSPSLATAKTWKLNSRRILARILDWLLITGVTVALIRIFGGHGLAWAAISLWLMVAYFFLCESIFGQTAGKNAMGLRVVRRDGGPPTTNSIAIRNVIRILEEPFLALLVLLGSRKRRQRIGDFAAGTTVGVERASVPPIPSRLRWVYPAVWAAVGALFVVAAHPPETPPTLSAEAKVSATERVSAETADYLSAIKSICKQRNREIKLSGEQPIGVILKSELGYTRQFAAVSAPPSMQAVRGTIVSARRRFNTMARWAYRELIRSGDPHQLFANVVGPRVQRVAKQTSREFERFGILCP